MTEKARPLLVLEARFDEEIKPTDYFCGLVRVLNKRILDLYGQPKGEKLRRTQEFGELILRAMVGWEKGMFIFNGEARRAIQGALLALDFPPEKTNSLNIQKIGRQESEEDYVPEWAIKKVRDKMTQDKEYGISMANLLIVKTQGQGSNKVWKKLVKDEARDIVDLTVKPNRWTKEKLRVQVQIHQEMLNVTPQSIDRLRFLERHKEWLKEKEEAKDGEGHLRPLSNRDFLEKIKAACFLF